MSTPTITPAVKMARSLVMWIILSICCVVVLSVITCQMATHKSKSESTQGTTSRSEVPLASRPISKWHKVTMEPGGKSVDIHIPVGRRIIKYGSKFRVHVRYYDKKEECSQIFGTEKDCPDGPVTNMYFTNLSKETNTVSYMFVPM